MNDAPIHERVARLEERVTGLVQAIKIGRSDIDRRLSEMNRLREQIEGERGQYVTVDRYNDRHEELSKRVSALENRVTAIEGGNLVKATTVTWMLAGLGLFITVVVVIVNFATAH